MRNNRSNAASNRTNVLVLTADADFEQLVRATFTAAAQIDLSVLTGTLAANEENITGEDATVIVIDLDTRRDEDLAALTRLMARLNGWPPVVVVTQSFDATVARHLLQMRVADFMVKPVDRPLKGWTWVFNFSPGF